MPIYWALYAPQLITGFSVFSLFSQASSNMFSPLNPLSNLPRDAFSSTKNLQLLDLSGTSGLIPTGPSLSCMPHLRQLYLSRVQLREIPEDVAELSNLTFLDLSENYISAVPETLTQVTLLEELTLASNNITVLNPKLGLLEPSLRSLKLEGNPIRSIRRAIVERGTKAVLEYLKNRLKSFTSIAPAYV